MKVQGVARPADPEDDLVRKNMVAFREEAKLSQAQAADLSGVPVDALRRYETGVTASVPGTELRKLARAYGHAVDDFFLVKPPSAKLEERPVFFLRTRDGVEIDEKVFAELLEHIDRANREMRGKKSRK